MSPLKSDDRWKWFSDNAGQLVSRWVTPKVLNYTQYVDACLEGMPPAALVHSIQAPRPWPLVVEWELDPVPVDETGWPPVGPTGPLAAALVWGGTLTEANSIIGAVWVQWSVNGVIRWQIMDMADRGKFVIGCADWVKVYAITCQSEVEEGVTVLPVEYPIKVCVRAAMEGERSCARVTCASWNTTQVSGGSVVLAWFGAFAKRMRIFAQSQDTSAFLSFAFLRSDLTNMESHAQVNAAGNYKGAAFNATWEGILPARTTYIATAVSTAAATSRWSIAGELD